MAPPSVANRDPNNPGHKRGPRRRRPTGRIILITLGALVLLAVILIALAPTIASGFVPGMAQRGINDQIDGRATVGRASLSWTGTQRIGPINIVDRDGRPVANIEIETSRGLFAILGIVTGRSPMDLGTTTVSGAATVIRRPDGTIHLQDVFQPGPPDAPPEDIYLPPTLTGTFILDALDITFIDERQLAERSEAAIIRIPALSGEASITNANQVQAQLAGHFLFGPTVAQALRPGGSLVIAASAADLTEPDGRLAIEQARYSANIDIVDVSVAIADLLANMEGRLVDAIGDQLRASARVDGTLADGQFSLSAEAPALLADLQFATVDGVVRTPQPGSIRLREGGLLPLIPGFVNAVAAQDDLTFERFPGGTLTVNNVNIPLPINGRPLDLRSGAFQIAIETGETIGRIRLPQPDGTPGELQEYRLAPIRAQIASQDLADRITIQARSQATLAGESAGDLEVDLAIIDPLDAQGQPRPPEQLFARDLDGIASLTGFATIILQPFVEGMGINMAQDVGPDLDFILRASATPEPQTPLPTGELPPTQLSLDIRSANISAAAGFLLAENILASHERGVELRINTTAPLLSRLFAQQGLVVESGAGATLTARDVRIDLARLAGAEDPRAPEGTADPAADLRAISGLLRLQTTPTAGHLSLPEQPVRRWEIASGAASIDATDLQRGIHILAQTSARLDGQEAGALDMDVRITELLDVEGRPIAGLPAIDGRASLSQFATAIIQPLVADMGIDLYRGVGPQLDLALVASSEASPDPAAAPSLPRTILDVTIRSDGVNGTLPLALDGGMLRTRGDGVRIDVRNPGVLLGPAALDAGAELSQGGFLRLIARDLAIAIDSDNEPLLDRFAGELELSLGGFAMRLLPSPSPAPGPPAPPLTLQELLVSLRFAPQHTPLLMLRGEGNHDGTTFSMDGSMQLVGLDAGPDTGFDLSLLRPIGELELRNLPTSLAKFAIESDAQATLDPLRLVQDLVGPSFNMNFTAAAIPDAAALDRRFALALRSDRLTAQADINLDREALHLRQFGTTAAVSPALAGTLLQMLVGEQLAAPPRVVQPAQLTASVQPLSIPIVNGVPDFTRAGEASLRAALQGRLIVDNITLAATPDRPARPIGIMGLEDVSLDATFPLASLAPGSPPAQTTFALAGSLLGSADAKLITLQSRGQAMIADGRPVGPMTANARLNMVNGGRLDQILGQDGMLVQAVGQTMNLEASANLDFPPPAQPAAPGTQPQAQAEPFAFQRGRIEATLTAPRLSTPQPIRLAILPDRFTLEAPATLNWQMHHNWANRFLLNIMPGAPPSPQEARFTQPTPLRLQIARLTLSRGDDIGPLLHGIFNAHLDVSSPGSEMLIGGVETRLAGLTAQFIGGHEENALGFNIRIQDAGGGHAPAGEPAVRFAGGVYGVADSLGQLTADAAAVSAQGAARNIPTAIIDGLSQQRGLLVDALGSLVNLDLQIRGLTRTGGAVNAVASSDRARAELRGTIRDSRFIADQPASISLSVITPELGRRMTQGIPLVGHFEKTTAEEPAMIQLNNLMLPLDGDLRGLNGQITFDPGEARLAVSRPFAPVLRLIDEPGEAVIGRRLQPITLQVNQGVMSYDRFNIPIGEFTFAMEGNVDLVNRRIDVITRVPVGALTEDVVGDLRTNLGRTLGIAPPLEFLTMVPFRARGEFGRFSVQPDLQMMGQDLQRELLRPDRILGDPARDLLDRLRPRRNDQPPAQPQPQQPPPPPAQPQPQQPSPPPSR